MMDDLVSRDATPVVTGSARPAEPLRTAEPSPPVEPSRPPEPTRPRAAPERFSDAHTKWVFRFLVAMLVVAGIWLARSLQEVLGSSEGWTWTAMPLLHLFPPLTLTIVALLALATHSYRGETRSFWYLSYGLAAFFVTCIIVTWIVLIHEPYRPPAGEILITTPAQLAEFERRYLFSFKMRVQGEEPIWLPTGVFIQTTEFRDTENLVMTGYVWQKYDDAVHEGLDRAFEMPDALNAHVEEAYRRRNGSEETVGWTFEAETREQFHYERFPFDVKDPWVRLWHKDLDRNVVLVPDLASYASTNPRELPGIEPRLVLPGWRIDRSFFSYKLHRYNTSFGVNAFQKRSDIPELYFTLVVRREFLSTFFLLLLPILVMLVLIFVIVYNMPPRHLGGEGLYNISRICGTYLFIMILNHVNLRLHVSGGIVYLEYFYVILYFGILWVLLNAALYLKGLNPPGIRWRENLIARVAFLPLVTGAMFVVTYLTFRG
jgi:hypothetical protein